MNKKKVISCIGETIIVNIIVYVIFFKIQYNQDVYLQLNPHPLFLLCIVMGMRYGNYLGIISAVISTLFYSSVFLNIHGDILLLFIYFKNYKYILLFFWSAIVMGVFKDNYVSNVAKLTYENKLIKDEYKQLDKDYKLSQKIQEELKKQIISSEESILNLYEIASSLSTFDLEELYTETMGILSKYLRASRVSIYTFNETSGYLRLKIRMGDIIADNRSMLVKDSIGLSKVVYEKHAVKWTEVKEGTFPLMSAPIIKDDKVLGIVNIEHMDFDKLSEYAFQLFKVIIEWINKAIDQAIYVDELKDSKYIDGTKILKYEAFVERIKEEERRKKEFSMEFVFLKYRVKDLSIGDIAEKMDRFLRSVDVISYNPEEKILCILMPATPIDKLNIIEERIFSRLNYQIERIDDVSKLIAVSR